MTDSAATVAARNPIKKTESRPRLGVAVLVRDRDGRLLLGQRGKKPNYGKWVIPGGGVKRGESLATTACREIAEETGLEIRLLHDRPFVQEVLAAGEHRVILFLQAEAIGGRLKAASDLLDARFFMREDIPVADVSTVVVPVLRELGWLPNEADQ